MSDIIQLLPDAVANQIAAGEVIQRPASVVKELMENAIDAGASSVTVRLKDAGKTLVQIIDNGHGLDQDSYDRVFKQHFTTKEQGHGFGLLAVKRVIKCHAGKVQAVNNPESGAEFNITFPIKPDENSLNMY